MASPFVPFSGGDFLPPAPTSGGMADDEPPPCSRCGFGGCDLRVAGCGCLLHTVSTPVFPRHVETGTKSYVLLFSRRMTTRRVLRILTWAPLQIAATLAVSLQMRGMRIIVCGAAVHLGSCVDVSSRLHGLMTCSTRCTCTFIRD